METSPNHRWPMLILINFPFSLHLSKNSHKYILSILTQVRVRPVSCRHIVAGGQIAAVIEQTLLGFRQALLVSKLIVFSYKFRIFFDIFGTKHSLITGSADIGKFSILVFMIC